MAEEPTIGSRGSRASRRAEMKPAGSRRGFRWGRFFGGLLVVLVLLAAGAAFAGWYTLLKPDTKTLPGQPVEVVIAKGSSTASIAQALSEVGVIENANMFRLKARSDQFDGQLKAGTYSFKTGTAYEAVLAKLVKGPDIIYYDVTIPEGFTARRIAARFAKRTGVDEAELLSLVTREAPRFAKDHPYLAGAYSNSLEGYLFPATYRIKKGTTAEQIVETMLDEFDQRISEVDLSYAKSKNLTLNDVVIIASAIEREARLAKERPLVSSVIYNRLHLGMRLQLCATVLYTMPDGTDRVTIADTKVETPYNTYRRSGLPAGPISNPGIASIQAAANPKQTKYLYYVLTGEDGSHTFTTGYAQFERAKAGADN